MPVSRTRLSRVADEWMYSLQLTQEICIHRSLRHNHVVAFHSFFDDKDNVYLLLELCRRRVSLFLVLFTPSQRVLHKQVGYNSNVRSRCGHGNAHSISQTCQDCRQLVPNSDYTPVESRRRCVLGFWMMNWWWTVLVLKGGVRCFALRCARGVARIFFGGGV